MNDQHLQRLGQPDLSLSGFQLWIHGQGPVDPRPYEDWLSVTAHCGAAGASVLTTGEILEVSDLVRWVEEAEHLHRSLAGVARLAPLEPALSIEMTADRLGHIAMVVDITPDHMCQRHHFEFELDQSFLPPFISQGKALLKRLASASV